MQKNQPLWVIFYTYAYFLLFGVTYQFLHKLPFHPIKQIIRIIPILCFPILPLMHTEFLPCFLQCLFILSTKYRILRTLPRNISLSVLIILYWMISWCLFKRVSRAYHELILREISKWAFLHVRPSFLDKKKPQLLIKWGIAACI